MTKITHNRLKRIDVMVYVAVHLFVFVTILILWFVLHSKSNRSNLTSFSIYILHVCHTKPRKAEITFLIQFRFLNLIEKWKQITFCELIS